MIEKEIPSPKRAIKQATTLPVEFEKDVYYKSGRVYLSASVNNPIDTNYCVCIWCGWVCISIFCDDVEEKAKCATALFNYLEEEVEKNEISELTKPLKEAKKVMGIWRYQKIIL